MSGFDMNYLYLLEARRQLQSAGFEALRDDDLLRVFLADRPLCRVTSTGAIRYHPEDTAGRDKAFDTVQDIAQTTWEYMTLLEQAPPLEAESLPEKYRLLSEFNGIVLAGRMTSFGAQFVTWEWTHNRTSLNQGNYYGPGSGGNYTAAKRDFVTRSFPPAPFLNKSRWRRSTAASRNRWKAGSLWRTNGGGFWKKPLDRSRSLSRTWKSG